MYRYDLQVGKEVTTFASPWEATAAARDMVMRKNAELVASDIYMTLFENEGNAMKAGVNSSASPSGS